MSEALQFNVHVAIHLLTQSLLLVFFGRCSHNTFVTKAHPIKLMAGVIQEKSSI